MRKEIVHNGQAQLSGRRTLAALLACLLLLTLLPTAALAADTASAPGGSQIQTAAQLQTALGGSDNASVDGNTVTLLKNVSIGGNGYIHINGKDLTLDLNGMKMSTTINTTILQVYASGGSFTLKDSSGGSGDLTGESISFTNTAVTIDGGKYSSITFHRDANGNYPVKINSGVFLRTLSLDDTTSETNLPFSSVFNKNANITVNGKPITDAQLNSKSLTNVVVTPITESEAIYISKVGSDHGTGTADSPLRTFARAKELISDNGTIYIAGTYELDGNSETWSLSGKTGVTVKRAPENTEPMIRVYHDQTLTLEDVVLDGALSDQSNTETGAIVVVAAGENSKLVMNNGAILQNNIGPAIQIYGDFIMNGGTIENNTLLTSSAAIIVNAKSQVEFNGGVIQSNIKKSDSKDYSICSAVSQGELLLSPSTTISGTISLDGASKLVFSAAPTGTYQLLPGDNYAKTIGSVVVELAQSASGTLDLTKFTMSSQDYDIAMGTGENASKIVLCKRVSDKDWFQYAIDNSNGTDDAPAEISISGEGLNIDTTIVIPAEKYIKLTGGTLTRANGFNNTMIVVKGTLTLENITLDGNKDNTSGDGILEVDGGKLTLNTGAILQNGKNSSNGGAIRICGGGTVIMNDGKITGNEALSGGGVCIFAYAGENEQGGTFTMNGGEISGNTAEAGSGVYVADKGTFNLHSNGTIKENAAPQNVSQGAWDGTITVEIRPTTYNTLSIPNVRTSLAATYGIELPSSPDSWGGGVYNMGTFTMDGGTISDNTAGRGGAIYHSAGSCTVTGGTISGNHNTYSGTGLYAREDFSIGGNAKIEDGIYLVTGKKALVTSALSNNIQIEGMEGTPTAGTVVAAGSSYTISNTDFGKFSINDTAWALNKNESGQIVLKSTSTPPTQSSDATLSALTYTVGNGQAVNVPNFTASTTSYNVVLPFGTSQTAVIALTGTVNDNGASITTNAGVTLSNGSGTATITVTAEDGTTKTYTVNFSTASAPSVGTAPSITTSSLPGGTVGEAYSQTLAATGDAPITWSVATGTLPDGLSLNGATISGTPTATGTFNFTVKATNATGDDTKALSITIDEPEPTVTAVTVTPATTDVQKGTTQQFTATVNGENDPAQTVTWALDGSHADGTSISESGLLTVASDETEATLTVKATSTVDDSVSGTATVTVTDSEVTRYTLTVNDGSGSGDYAQGAEITVTAETKAGQRFKKWTAEGITLDDETVNPVTITMPGEAVTLTATYEDVYAVTAQGDSNGTATAAPALAAEGETVTISATANSGYQFKEWEIVSGTATLDNASEATTTFAMPGEAVTVKAVFEPTGTPPVITYTITFDANGGNSLTPSAAQTGADGKLSSLPTPTRSGSYSFAGWYTAATGGDAVTTNTVFSNNTTIYAHWTYTGSSSGSGSGGGSNTTTSTTTNADGSTTTTTTNKATGTVTETTKAKDGTQTVVETKKDGSKKETVTTPDGTKTETATTAQGDMSYTERRTDGTRISADIPKSGEATATVNLPSDTTAPVVASFPVIDGTVVLRVLPDGTEEPVAYSLVEGGRVYVRLDGDAELRVETRAGLFDDMDGHWAKEYADFTGARELFQGTAPHTFTPERPMTRAMLTTVLYRMDGMPETGEAAFSDVDNGAWYADGVAWASENGIAAGTSSGVFSAGRDITRQELAVMLWNYAKYDGIDVSIGEDTNILSFTDIDKAGEWAIPALQWACGAGILQGNTNGTLNPTGSATRAQVAAMLERFVATAVK